MQKLQDSVFSIIKSANLSPAVFSYLQPSEDLPDKTPLGGILRDAKHGWLALGARFCVVDLRSGLKVAARTFGALSNYHASITSVVELPAPLTENTQQLIISLECEENTSLICVFHINGSQLLKCIQTEIAITQLAVCDGSPNGPFSCFDGLVMAGTKNGEIIVFDLNRASLMQALKDILQGYEQEIRNEDNPSNIVFLPLTAINQLDNQRDIVLEDDDHIAVLLNENSLVDGQYIFRNPDGTIRMKAKRDHVRVTVLQYIPQLGSMAVGFNFGAFQIWNIMNLDLEFTSQVNVECLPVTHFGFQEPCDDPRAFCYLWVVFSVMDRFEEEEFPLAVMYSLTYQGKRMLSDTKCLYQEFLMATIRFQVELSTTEENAQLVGGRCISCHTYSVNSTLGGEGEDSMLNICQLVWECWGENAKSSTQHGLLLFDLDQWYKDQMPATYQLQSNAFMSATCCTELCGGGGGGGGGGGQVLDVAVSPGSVAVYCARAPTRLEEHFYPNSLHYNCICLTTSECCVLSTIGIQRQIINSMDEVGPTALLNPTRLYNACVATGLTPLYMDVPRNPTQEEQRRYLLSVALEARLSRLLSRCAHDWAAGTHSGAGCTLPFLVDWCWNRAIELKENAKELTAPLFTSSALPDRNVVRCLEHCVQQLTQLTGLLDAVLTKCCNLVVPDALSEMEEKYKGIGTVALYFRVIQWLVSCGLLPERGELPFPAEQLVATYTKRRLKLHRLEDNNCDDTTVRRPCGLLYIDQLIEHEFGGERIRDLWLKGGSECHGLYPPPSLYSLLRLYLLPDVAEEHKHSLVLYLLVDYSMVYDELRYEAVVRRLMQFPTMFGLSNTAIKATQAFWHLDHRDFDFALDQLQCLTGNTLSEWQHNVVLSSLLAQNKTQAALQYLHVRKPPPIQSPKDDFNRVNDHDKLDDWQSCCNLYLARGLVFEALDVIRMCVQNAGSMEEKTQVLVFFFRGCRNTGNLAKVLQITLMPFEEKVFIKYLEDCNESQTSDILIMYYLQQARYLEAELYNNKIKTRFRTDLSSSVESVNELGCRASARDLLVSVSCGALPPVTSKVATCAMDIHNHVIVPKPMSVYVTAKSPKNTFTYKSTFIQDTIESASETWLHKPKLRKGLKRALNIEETPFICTPKLSRTKSFLDAKTESTATPSKRPRLDLSGTPKTPAPYKNETLSKEMSILLEMPDIQSPSLKLYDRGGAETPHSILKTRSESALGRPETASPVDSRYLPDSDEELLETGSNHTHYSDSTNKQLRFIIPHGSTATTPSPETLQREMEREQSELERDKENRVQRPPPQKEWDVDMSFESCVTTTETHAMSEPNPMESPPKRFATSENVRLKKIYKDTVKARRSLSISANSSLSDDPNTSIESIADIPVTLINPRYSGEKRRTYGDQSRVGASETKDVDRAVEEKKQMDVPRTPRGRRSIRATDESTPLFNRSRSATPERQDSPIHPLRMTRSRSRTPEVSPRLSPLITIPEQPKQEVESEPHPEKTMLSVSRIRSKSRTPERKEKKTVSPRLEAITESKSPESSSPVRSLRSRSRTPERKEREKLVDSPRLEAITESNSPEDSPVRRSLRSRSRTPEFEMTTEESTRPSSPRALRSRAKTPEKLMSPKKELPRSGKKSLSRIVLEANAFAKTKQLIETGPIMEIPEVESETPEKSEESQNIIECTPMKPLKPVPSLMDVTISPIASKSVLQSSSESIFAHSKEKVDESPDSKSLLVFTISETKFGKSVLKSFNSTAAETTELEESRENKVQKSKLDAKSFPVFTLSESCFEKSVLKSYQSSIADTTSGDVADKIISNKTDIKPASTSLNVTELNKSVLRSADSSAVQPAKKATDNDETNKTLNKDVSSLITDDSEIELKEEGESNAAVIQKEKEKIVEIEREINEIEGDMLEDEDSDVLRVDTDSGAQSDESEPAEGEESSEADSDSEDEGMEEDSSDEDEGDSSDEDENSEVISINDSESNDTNSNAEEQNSKSEENNKEEQMEVETEKDKITDPTDEESASIDPLNQAQCSIMTDDNSVKEAEQTMNLNYSDEIKGNEVEKMDTSEKAEIPIETDTNVGQPEAAIQIEIVVESNPVKKISDKNIPIQTQDEPKKQEVETIVKEIDVVDSRTEVKATVDSGQSEKVDFPIETKVSEDKNNIIIEIKPVAMKDVTSKKTDEGIKITTEVQANKSEDKNSGIIEIKPIAMEGNVINKKTDKEKIKTEVQETQIQAEENKDEKKPITRRKRGQSVSSVKSTTSEGKKSDIDEPKTPVTRKRSLSIASTQSTEQKTPEKEETTPNTPTTRRRAKTPTSAEVRKILTRRASKELSEKLDDSQTSILEDSMALTPKRRSTRSRSKNQDDDVSIASGSSVRSTRSRASEDAGDKPQVRKGRKSIVATKPDLSVIPESIIEESKGEVTEEMMEYSTSRRLTRHQKAVMESFTQPHASPRRGRRGSVASKSSVTELQDDDGASSTHSSTYDPHVADRIALLNKGDFEGSTESSEPQSSCTSPLESIASDASKQRRARIGRAASESRTTPKLTKISRRISVDVVTRPESPAVDSPATRARRASFNRACEALHTPKGRRASTDVKKGDPDTVSQSSSPSSEGTATRRGRRASTQSAASDTANKSRNV